MIIGRIANRGTISASEIKQAYIKAFNISLCQRKKVCFHLADETYGEANPTIIEAILHEDKTNEEVYEAERFDCDDYAFRLMGVFHSNDATVGMSIFIIWVLTPEGGHALLSYYYQGNVKLLEPQDDSIFSPPSDWRLMLIIG